jgi:hypothetical protein
MKKYLFFSAAFVIFIFSCSLSRKNPLDPVFSGIYAPSVVENIQVTRVNATTSTIEWNAHVDEADSIDVDGYYIYRSFHHNGLYELRTTRSKEDTLFTDNTALYNGDDGVWSYYKMSAFKYVAEADANIEGTRSGIRYHGDEY